MLAKHAVNEQKRIKLRSEFAAKKGTCDRKGKACEKEGPLAMKTGGKKHK